MFALDLHGTEIGTWLILGSLINLLST